MSTRIILALAAVALLGCSDAATRPQDPDTTQPRLIECPTDQTSTKSGLIDVFGGTVAAAGTGISLPPGAVLTETLISVTVPASTYMEVEFTANELLTFDFLKTVFVTIDYSRCPAGVGAGISVWLIDTNTKALILNMNGLNDPVYRQIFFRTNHLSGYAIAQ